MKNKLWNRRKFFSSVGLGFLGLSIFGSPGFKLLANQNKILLKEKIKVNPLAVKRNK